MTFKKDDTLYTLDGETVTVLGIIDKGRTQGEIYRVIYQGREMALKWYKTHYLEKMQQSCIRDFYKNLKNNVAAGAPSPEFIWPVALCKVTKNSFGYIMELLDKKYVETALILRGEKRISKRNRLIAAQKLSYAYSLLDEKGLCYGDISGGNVFIDPATGDIRIIDNDNVVPNGQKGFVAGTPRFMAPQIVLGNSPSIIHDRHSLAVLCFRLLFGAHPLEGKKYYSQHNETVNNIRIIYGVDPIFVMDPDNAANRPVRDKASGRNILNEWPNYPPYIRELFIHTLSHAALKDKPETRNSACDFVHAFSIALSQICECRRCGKEFFFSVGGKCPACEEEPKFPFSMEFDGYTSPVIDGRPIYAAQLGKYRPHDALHEMLEFYTHDNRTVLRNCSGRDIVLEHGAKSCILKNTESVYLGVCTANCRGSKINFKKT